MTPFARIACLGLVASAAMTGVASAQYYPPGPSYPVPGPYYGRPDYAPPPPPPPGYYQRRWGNRCEAYFPNGARVFCQLYRPKELGDGCVCPPRFAGAPNAEGRVIP